MDAKTFNMLDSRIDLYVQAISDFESFHEEYMKHNLRKNNNFYDETLKHANKAKEIYDELIRHPELPEGFRNILDRKKRLLTEKLALLERKYTRKNECVGV
ncbi:hypothetical protein KY342_06595 [Candidatus Woesearchaeota archaeon]|nr:hypothetical protein [Candidatus Woesearchaeota archaeon]